MKEQNEKLRTTIYIDEQLVKRAEVLFGEAKVNSFSAFASKAIEEYITRLVVDKNSDLLSDEIRKAIKNEIGPLGSRISKGLYRYAVFLDVLVHIVGWRCKFTNDAIEKLRRALDYIEMTDGDRVEGARNYCGSHYSASDTGTRNIVTCVFP